MEDISNMSMFELACELNNIMIDINKLQMRYNRVVNEITSRNEKLKDDPNLQPIDIRKEEDFERDTTHKLWQELCYD